MGDGAPACGPAEWRRALAWAARLGLIPPPAAEQASERLRRQLAVTVTADQVAAWAGLDPATLAALVALPAEASEAEARRALAAQGADPAPIAETPTLLRDATPPTLLRDPTPPTIPSTGWNPNIPRNLGPYELLGEIGHGGMGIVFRARHARLGTTCAVKVLIAGEYASPDSIARFQREAAAVARMGKHPNVVGVFDLGQEGSLAYYAMELVEGTSLGRLLREREFAYEQSAAIVEKAAGALHFAHEHGVIHRDVKPDNIVLRPDGEPQVMDFGLAREVGSDQRLSRTGQILGTPAYMSPEQARGEVERTDRRTDVFSLGAVLYEMLTRIPPHGGRSVEQVLHSVLSGVVVPPRSLRSDIPRDIETICLKCLSTEPSGRYPTAEALAEDLARWRRGEPILARPVGAVIRAARRIRKNPRVSALVASVLVLAAWFVWMRLGPARLLIETDPSDAVVRVNGQPLERGGWVWPARALLVQVSADGHEPQERRVEVSTGTNDLGGWKLVPLPATLRVTCTPQGATVTVMDPAGKLVSRLSPPVAGQALAQGEYDIEAVAEGMWTRRLRLNLRPGETAEARFALNRQKRWVTQVSGSPVGTVDLGDLDADGVLDVAVLTRGEGGRPFVQALSGRDGRPLWEATLPKGAARRLEASDADQDGWLDAIVVGESAIAVSGRDGTLLGTVDVESLAPAVRGDLDGDSVEDVVIRAADLALEASSGKDGHVLWTFGDEELIVQLPLIVRLGPSEANDCVFGTQGATEGKVYALSGATGKVRWSRKVGNSPRVAGTPIDFNRDGTLDCVVAGTGGPVVVLSGRDGALLTEVPTENGTVVSPLVCDLEGDGVADAILTGSVVQALTLEDGPESSIYHLPGKLGHRLTWRPPDRGEPPALLCSGPDGVFAASVRDGRILWQAARPAGTTFDVADLDADGAPDALQSDPDGTVRAVSGRDGHLLWSVRAEEEEDSSTVSVADLDRDGAVEVIVGTGDGTLRALRGRDGTLVWQVDLGEFFLARPAYVDVDGDGGLDAVMITSDSVCHALSGKDGHAIWSAPVPVCPVLPLVHADLDGDGVEDFVVSGWEGTVCTVSGRQGGLLWRWQFPGGRMAAISDLADVSGDGTPDCAVGTREDGLFLLSGRDGRVLWRHLPVETSLMPMVLTAGHGGSDAILACSADDQSMRVIRIRGAGNLLTTPYPLLHGMGAWQTISAEAAEPPSKAAGTWERAVAHHYLAISLLRQARPKEALAAFSEARALGLKAPDGAVHEWVAAWRCTGDTEEQRETAGERLQEALLTAPGGAVDAFVECGDLLPTEGIDALAAILDAAQTDERGRVAAIVICCLPLADKSRRLMPVAPAEKDLLQARAETLARLSAGRGSAAREFAYLAVIAEALGDRAGFLTAARSYEAMTGRTRSLDLLVDRLSRRMR